MSKFAVGQTVFVAMKLRNRVAKVGEWVVAKVCEDKVLVFSTCRPRNIYGFAIADVFSTRIAAQYAVARHVGG